MDYLTPSCPKCGSSAHVVSKLILIGKLSPKGIFSDSGERAGYQRKDQLAIDECLPGIIRKEPLEQFIDGYFCDECGNGFVPDEFLRNEN